MGFLEVRNVTKYFGFPALKDVSLSVEQGERVGLIGPNGSGKTTLNNVITGLLRSDGGQVVFENRDISRFTPHKRARLGIARTYQIPQPFYSLSILENLLVPLRYTNESNPEEKAMDLLPPRLQSKCHESPGQLTQIELRELELARALALSPKLVILDEVLAGLTAAEVDEALVLLDKIADSGITIIMIEHIMKAVMGFSDRIIVLNSGMKIAEGAPGEIFNNAEVERAYLGE